LNWALSRLWQINFERLFSLKETLKTTAWVSEIGTLRTLILMRDINQFTRPEIKGLFILRTAIMIFALKSTGG
jgi:hypothetical protein